MDNDYWTTIAQICATFIGIVIVGIALFIGSTRTAVKEMEALSRVQTAFKEQSTELSYVLTISNLILFIWPMRISLYFTGESESHLLFWSSLAMLFGLLVVTVILFEHKIHNRIFLLRSGVNTSSFIARLRFRFVVYLFGLLFCLLHVNYHFSLFNAVNIAISIKVISVLSIIFGMAFSLFDLLLFDVEHTLFQLPDDFPLQRAIACSTLFSDKTRIDIALENYKMNKLALDNLILSYGEKKALSDHLVNKMAKLNSEKK